MRRFVPSSAPFAVAFVAAMVTQRAEAVAQSCSVIPALDESVCLTRGSSIEEYKACYRDLYDKNVIPAFAFIASCSHQRADAALNAVLEGASALVTGTIKTAIESIDRTLAAPGGPSGCIRQLNDINTALGPIITEESKALDLDAYRRSHYGFEQLTTFTSLVLGARQNRAACSDALLSVRKSLVLLSELKAKHLDYCQVLRSSARYEDSSRIQSLAQWTAVDPDIQLDRYFNVSVGWNTQCGYFDYSNAGANLRYTPCLQTTLEYKQTLTELDQSWVGWLSDHSSAIAVTSGAIAGTVASLAGAGAAAGPIGAAIGGLVGGVIAGITYWKAHNELEELNDLIAAKEQQLKDIVQQSYITQPEFDAKVETLCSAWKPIVEGRVQNILGSFDAAKHIQAIDAYFALSDKLHGWYNELFLWATDGASGQRFIDELTEQQLLEQRNAFDQEIFRARTDQEIAAQENALATLKGNTSLINCSVSGTARRGVQARLRGALNVFNLKCSSLLTAIGVRTKDPVPFSAAGATSDVACSYSGFRSDVASVEIRAGAGFTSDMTLRDPAGGVIAELAGVSSASPPSFPGFSCASSAGLPFGTSAESALRAGTYTLQLTDNIYGFGPAEAQALRPFVKDIDSKMRYKAVVCNRQLGVTISLPLTAGACGIPVTF